MTKMIDRWKTDDDGDVWLEIVPPVKRPHTEVLKKEEQPKVETKDEPEEKDK